jgi:hypothetical protein
MIRFISQSNGTKIRRRSLEKLKLMSRKLGGAIQKLCLIAKKR